MQHGKPGSTPANGPVPDPARQGEPAAASPPTAPLSVEPRYQQLFESSPMPLWVYDLETLRFLDVNEVACLKYGYTRDEFLSMSILDIRPREDAGAVMASVRETPAGVFNSGIWRHRLRDGSVIDVEVTSHEMRYMGRNTRFVCPIDVTERLHAEATLRSREAALRRAQSVARLAHLVTGPDGALEDWSENLPCLLGMSAAELPGSLAQWAERLVHPEDRADFVLKTTEATRRGQRVEFEYRLQCPAGHGTCISQVIEPTSAAEAPAGPRWFSTLQDVTEQRATEERLRKLTEELEERVRQRTEQLVVSNRELQAATLAAEQASLAKSRFLSNISHELRTPLNAILGFGQLLNVAGRGVLSEHQQTMYGDNIVAAGKHLLTLINELLDLASIEAGKTSVAVERLALDEVFDECIRLMAPLAQQRQIGLEVRSGVPPHVMADRMRLKQVLLNLLSNAIKYSPEHSRVDLGCEQLSDGKVRISITDHGSGMTAQQVAALYQPFNRLGRERTGAEGSGIGLVVTRSLVELMDGQMGVDSTPGVGSTFWLTLPGEPGWRSPQADAAVHAHPPSPVEAGAAVATILCVDDDAASLRLVQDLLATRADVAVITATNGRIGVELALAHRPSAIVMDNNMPEMTGTEARRVLRADPRTADIPIIALSASPPTPAESIEGGPGLRYVSKPFEIHAFLGAIDAALADARRAGSSPADPASPVGPAH
jgi:PAS domain S-box-containing protein